MSCFESSGLIARLTVIKLVSNSGIVCGLAKIGLTKIGATGFKVCGLVGLQKARSSMWVLAAEVTFMSKLVGERNCALVCGWQQNLSWKWRKETRLQTHLDEERGCALHLKQTGSVVGT